MPCAEFENLLLDYAEVPTEKRRSVDTHLARCDDCRAFRDALTQLDAALTSTFGKPRVSPAFRASVLRRISAEVPIRRPSYVPEILDFVGWAAVVAIFAGLMYQVVPLLPNLLAALESM